jgi:DNA-binding transcriptional LysR family regulator
LRRERTTAVAERLGLSQSAISHALARLRDIFGDPLFLRRSDGLTPTRRARELAPKIRNLMRLTQEAVSGPPSFDPASSQRVFRLAANDLAATLFGPPLLQRLEAEAPGSRLTTRFAVGAEALDGLRRDDTDVAIGRFYEKPDSFSSSLLLQESFVVVARRDHPAIGASLDLETYVRLDHVLVSFAGKLTGVADQALAFRGLQRRVRVSVPMYLAAFAMVSRSDLIATVPMRLASRLAVEFRLKVLAPPLAIEGFPVSLVWYNSARVDPGLDWLVARIREIASEMSSNPPVAPPEGRRPRAGEAGKRPPKILAPPKQLKRQPRKT